VEELQAQVRTQADADDQVMTYVNTEVEKWKVRLLSFSADVFLLLVIISQKQDY